MKSISPSKNAVEYALPDVLLQNHPGAWRLMGSGVFSWSVFKLYNASLYALGDFDAHSSFALDLSYLRTITAAQIVTTSLREIERLRTPSVEQARDWAVALLNILPDVRLGDRLIGLFLPDTGVRFFSQNIFLGEILDPVFAQAFAAIWLDPETQSPGLRSRLLGKLL